MFNNATQAAVDAKFAKGSAKQTASRLMTIDYVKAGVAKAKALIAKKHDITADRVLKEYAKIGFTNMEDFTEDSDDGVCLRELPNISRDNMAAVKSVKITTTTERDGKGKPTRTHRTTQFELHSKTKALDALGKNLGIFEADNFQRGGAKTIADIFALIAGQRRTKIVDSVECVEKTLIQGATE